LGTFIDKGLVVFFHDRNLGSIKIKPILITLAFVFLGKGGGLEDSALLFP
jgi:preprotein translocase subunit Sec61beta